MQERRICGVVSNAFTAAISEPFARSSREQQKGKREQTSRIHFSVLELAALGESRMCFLSATLVSCISTVLAAAQFGSVCRYSEPIFRHSFPDEATRVTKGEKMYRQGC